MYGEVLSIILKALKSRFGVFGYIDETGDLICPSMTRDIWDQCQIPNKKIRFPKSSWGGIWGRAMLERETKYSNEPFKVPEGHIQIENAIDVPIIHHGELIGNLMVGNKENGYNKNDVELLESIANKISPILFNRLQLERKNKQLRDTIEVLKISEKKLKESEERFKKEKTTLDNIIDLNPYAIVVFDKDGHNIRRNQAFINFFKSIPPKDYSVFDDPIIKKAGYENELIKAKNGEVMVIPEVWYNPHWYDPQYPSVNVCFRMVIFPIFDRNATIENYVAISEDITERKFVEKELKESEVKYREAFHRENFYKDLFAHDMRNILQAIRNSLEIFEFKFNTKKSFIQNKNLFENIFSQIDRGAHLINNIKKFSDLDSFEQSLIELNIYQLIQMNIINIQKTYRNKNILIQLEPNTQTEFFIIGNELINDVIDNILLNSIIHNDNEEIQISIVLSRILKNQKPYIRVEFSDNGRGIEDSRKKVIFNRAIKQDKSTIGLGLGLSLVKKIIEKLDGYIWVEDKVLNDYKQGIKLVILLPQVN